MKIFIIFLGLLIVNMSIMSYRGDYGKYVYLHSVLDNIAFECAQIAVLDTEEAQMLADGMLSYMINNLRGVNVRNYSCEITAEDGLARVLIRMNVEKLFSFPFSPVTGIVSEKSIRDRAVSDD